MVLHAEERPFDARRIARVYEELREAHPELREALRWNGARAVLRRLRIPIVTVPLTRGAGMLSAGGVTVFLINSNVPPRRHTSLVAHELAHSALHVDAEDPRELVFHMPVDWAEGDPREDEADFLATLILGGPRFYDAVRSQWER